MAGSSSKTSEIITAHLKQNKSRLPFMDQLKWQAPQLLRHFNEAKWGKDDLNCQSCVSS